MFFLFNSFSIELYKKVNFLKVKIFYKNSIYFINSFIVFLYVVKLYI